MTSVLKVDVAGLKILYDNEDTNFLLYVRSALERTAEIREAAANR